MTAVIPGQILAHGFGTASIITTIPGGTPQVEDCRYNLDGQVATVSDGTVGADPRAIGIASTLATVTYTAGQLSSVKYGNGSILSSVTLDLGTGATTAISWAFPDGIDTHQNLVTDRVLRPQSGRIVADTLTDGSATSSSAYAFDAQGRLTSAVIPDHTLSYGFGAASCGANVNAGADGDRTSFTDTHNGVESSGGC